MVFKQFLQSIKRKSDKSNSKIREIERRIKIIEEENATALIEPLFAEPMRGRGIINCNTRNTVDENSPDTVFQNSGTFETDENGGTPLRKICFLKFEKSVKQIMFAVIGMVEIKIDGKMIAVTDTFTSQKATIRAALVRTDFDPTTITFNNAPDSPTFGTFDSQELNMEFTSDSDLKAGNSPGSLQNDFTLPKTQLFFESTTNADGPFFGMYIYFLTDLNVGTTDDGVGGVTAQVTDPFDDGTALDFHSFAIKGRII